MGNLFSLWNLYTQRTFLFKYTFRDITINMNIRHTYRMQGVRYIMKYNLRFDTHDMHMMSMYIMSRWGPAFSPFCHLFWPKYLTHVIMVWLYQETKIYPWVHNSITYTMRMFLFSFILGTGIIACNIHTIRNTKIN